MWIPVVNPQLCKGCEVCVEICPDNAIEIVEKKSFIDYNRCTCCGVCDRACRYGALEVKHPQMPAVLEDDVQLTGLKAEVKILKQKLKEMRKEVRL